MVGAIVKIGSQWAKQTVQGTPFFRVLDGESRLALIHTAFSYGVRQ
jgi:hypothetical protein